MLVTVVGQNILSRSCTELAKEEVMPSILHEDKELALAYRACGREVAAAIISTTDRQRRDTRRAYPPNDDTDDQFSLFQFLPFAPSCHLPLGHHSFLSHLLFDQHWCSKMIVGCM